MMASTPAIFHLTSGHRSFDDRIFYKEARSLAKRHRVFLLSAGRDGELVDMGGNPKPCGSYEGVEMRAFGPARRGGIAGKLERAARSRLGLPSMPGLLGRATRAIEACGARPALIHLHDPDLLKMAGRLKREYGCKIVFDCHEYYYWYFDEGSFSSGRYFNAALRRHAEYRRLFAPCDAVISVTDTMRAMNWCLRPEIAHETLRNSTLVNRDAGSRSADGRLRLVHEGSLSFDRGFGLMMELFDDPAFRDKAKLRIVGNVGKAERSFLDARIAADPGFASCVEATGWVAYEELPNYLDGDIGLVFMDPIPNNYLGLPNKFFNYIGAGLPIVSTPQHEIGQRLGAFGLGVVSATRDAGALRDAISAVGADLAGYRERVRSHRPDFSWGSEEPKLLALYDRLLGGSRG